MVLVPTQTSLQYCHRMEYVFCCLPHRESTKRSIRLRFSLGLISQKRDENRHRVASYAVFSDRKQLCERIQSSCFQLQKIRIEIERGLKQETKQTNYIVCHQNYLVRRLLTSSQPLYMLVIVTKSDCMS